MSHAWVTAGNGDLLRADQIRQLNTAMGLRAVLVGGDQFLLAEIGDREECATVARELTAAIATADDEEEWAQIAVERNGPAWTVKVESTPSA